MKKWVCLLLTAAMIFGLAACTGSTNASPAPSDATTSPVPGADKPVLRVAMECDDAPYSWTQQDDSNGAVPIAGSSDYACGYDVMIAKLISVNLGLELNVTRLEKDQQIEALRSGIVDCVICNQSITDELQKTVDFTVPYNYTHIVALTKSSSKYASANGLSDLAGAACTSVMSTVWYDECLAQIPNAKIQPSEMSAPAMMVALDSNRVKLVVTDHPTAMAACLAYPDIKILDFSGTDDNFQVSDEDVNMGISVRKGNSELLDDINGILATLTGKDLDSMMQEAVSIYGVQSYLLEIISFG